MKKQVLIAGLSLITAIAFGQKKEVRKAEKAVEEGKYTEALDYINQAEASIATADNELQAKFYIYKGYALAETANNDFKKMKLAVDALKKAEELKVPSVSDQLNSGIATVRAAIVNSAIDDQNAKNYKIASEKLYTSYNLSKKDTSDLFYAGANALNAQDYQNALQYFNTLLDLGYTGITTEIVAVDVETGEEKAFNTEKERDFSVQSGSYTNPQTRKTTSQKGDILKYVTMIYLNEGNNDKAMEVIKQARMENPEDVSLLRSEAELAYKMGDIPLYNKLMAEVVASDPTNPELYFNLGTASSEINADEEAMQYYKKALELDPNYSAAQINAAALLLKGESAIVEEMNSLGTSAAENKRYEALKQKRKDLYLEVAAYLEPAYKADPQNVDVVRTLMNIYVQTNNDAKFKEMKAKMAELEGN